VALYQVSLEDERLGLARGDYEVYLPNALAELRYLRAAVAGAGEVARHPAPDVLGLAHVHDPVRGIFEDVDAGRGREVGPVGESVLGHLVDYIAPECVSRVSVAFGAGFAAANLRPRRDHVVPAGPGVTGPTYVPTQRPGYRRDQNPSHPEWVEVRHEDREAGEHRECRPDQGKPLPPLEIDTPGVEGEHNERGRGER
jgi:hypothetical protein